MLYFLFHDLIKQITLIVHLMDDFTCNALFVQKTFNYPIFNSNKFQIPYFKLSFLISLLLIAVQLLEFKSITMDIYVY